MNKVILLGLLFTFTINSNTLANQCSAQNIEIFLNAIKLNENEKSNLIEFAKWSKCFLEYDGDIIMYFTDKYMNNDKKLVNYYRNKLIKIANNLNNEQMKKVLNSKKYDIYVRNIIQQNIYKILKDHFNEKLKLRILYFKNENNIKELEGQQRCGLISEITSEIDNKFRRAFITNSLVNDFELFSFKQEIKYQLIDLDNNLNKYFTNCKNIFNKFYNEVINIIKKANKLDTEQDFDMLNNVQNLIIDIKRLIKQGYVTNPYIIEYISNNDY